MLSGVIGSSSSMSMSIIISIIISISGSLMMMMGWIFLVDGIDYFFEIGFSDFFYVFLRPNSDRGGRCEQNAPLVGST